MFAIQVPSVDSAYNLALEEVLFHSITPEHPGWFLLWRNSPSIIIGRHQNTVEEINETYTRKHELPVVRRSTGGGAVYHDEGNINFSFLRYVAQNQTVSFATFLEPVLRALRGMGLDAEFTSRNDITVQGRKISGSAQRRNGFRVLHHGTVMVDLDMSILGQALTGNPDKFESKGVNSHRARVANLREFLPATWSREECLQQIMAALIDHCSDGMGEITPEIDAAAQRLAQEKYRSWDWNYGKSPSFTERRRKRFPWGALECSFSIKDGIIQQCRMHGDFFSARDMRELEELFCGVPRDPEALSARLESVPLECWFVGGERESLLNFFRTGE